MLVMFREPPIEPRRNLGPFRPWTLCLSTACLLLGCWVGDVSGLDPVAQGWTVESHDCPLRLLPSLPNDDSGRTNSTEIRMEAGNGTFVHCGYSIEATPIIEELQLRVPVRADRPGMQIFARVVLPRDSDPATGEPRTVRLVGSVYEGRDAWEKLVLSDLGIQLQERLRVLRLASGASIDGREAFVDRVYLNLYGGRGITRVHLGAPEVLGQSRPMDVGAQNQIGIQRLSNAMPDEKIVRLEGGILNVDEQPIFPRILDDAGTTWETARALGFNTIRLLAPPTAEQIDQANKLGLWLIAPFPDRQTWLRLRPHTGRVLAWEIHDAARRTPDAEALVGMMHARPAWTRPLLGPSPSDILMSVGMANPGSWNSTTSPYWASIRCELPFAAKKQLQWLGLADRPAPLELDRLERCVFTAIQDGARGIHLLTDERLGDREGGADIRGLGLRALLERLTWIEPWLAGGERPMELAEIDAEHRGVLFAKHLGGLVLIVQRERDGRASSTESTGETTRPLTLTIPGCGADSFVFRMLPGGPVAIPARDGPGGGGITLEDPDQVEFLVVTKAPLHVGSVARRCAVAGKRILESREMLLVAMARETEAIATRLSRSGTRRVAGELSLGRSLGELGRARHMIAAGDWEKSHQALVRASKALADSRSALLQDYLTAHHSAGAAECPLDGQVSTIDIGVRRRVEWQRLPWKTLHQASSEFESLEPLLDLGWRAYDLGGTDGQGDAVAAGRAGMTENIQASVSLANVHYDGEASLTLSVSGRPSPESKALSDRSVAPRAWVVSPLIHLPGRQYLRVEGWALVADDGDNQPARLLVRESLGGDEMALCLEPGSGWQPFVIYRATEAPCPWNLTFAMAGTGVAHIDHVSTRISSRDGGMAASFTMGASDAFLPASVTSDSMRDTRTSHSD